MKNEIEVKAIVAGPIKSVKAKIFGIKNGMSAIYTLNPSDWEVAKVCLLINAQGCFSGNIGKNGELVSSLSQGALMKSLHHARAIVL